MASANGGALPRRANLHGRPLGSIVGSIALSVAVLIAALAATGVMDDTKEPAKAMHAPYPHVQVHPWRVLPTELAPGRRIDADAYERDVEYRLSRFEQVLELGANDSVSSGWVNALYLGWAWQKYDQVSLYTRDELRQAAIDHPVAWYRQAMQARRRQHAALQQFVDRTRHLDAGLPEPTLHPLATDSLAWRQPGPDDSRVQEKVFADIMWRIGDKTIAQLREAVNRPPASRAEVEALLRRTHPTSWAQHRDILDAAGVSLADLENFLLGHREIYETYLYQLENRAIYAFAALARAVTKLYGGDYPAWPDTGWPLLVMVHPAT
jgi:hypothetical protein